MINFKRFALAGGVLGALWLFVFTLIALGSGHGIEFLRLVENILPGYHITVLGSLVGAVYGFILGFIELAIVAYVYNSLEKCVK